MKCVACGSTNLIAGELADGTNEAVRFRPSGTPRLKQAFGVGNRKVKAYACAHCHNLQLTVELQESDRTRHQRFEGQQPGIVERLADDD